MEKIYGNLSVYTRYQFLCTYGRGSFTKVQPDQGLKEQRLSIFDETNTYQNAKKQIEKNL